MELEFDKEINAILRKARDSGVADATAAESRHIDAETIAAFAENALPEKSKMAYTQHFADCERCRKILFRSIMLNAEAGPAAASLSDLAPVEAAVPWYQKILKIPNLALAM